MIFFIQEEMNSMSGYTAKFSNIVFLKFEASYLNHKSCLVLQRSIHFSS